MAENEDTRAYEPGDKIQLASQEVTIEKCVDCDHLMVNLDADQLQPGDLSILKRAKVRISNPDTEKAYCVGCEHLTLGDKLASWFDDDDDDDDSSFFRPSSSGSIFGGHSSFGGFGGGFGGFGGGGFGGGGASRGF